MYIRETTHALLVDLTVRFGNVRYPGLFPLTSKYVSLLSVLGTRIMTTEEDADWELYPRKTKKRKKDHEHEKCIIHNDSVPSSNFIELTQDTLINLQNIKTRRMKEPAGSTLRISANEYSMLFEDTPIGDGYGYHRLCYDLY